MKDKHPDIVIRHIKTKSKIRKIVSYCSDECELRQKHQSINNFIQDRFIPSIFSKAYIKNCSIYDNVKAHLYNDCFILMDIKNFFHNICHKQLSDKLFFELNLIEENTITRKECNQIVNDCSINSRGIPLGFVTSPILSNIYLKDFDGIFYGKLKKFDLKNTIYTRYADDLVVSFKAEDLIQIDTIKHEIIELAKSILKRYGLRLNPKKTQVIDLNKSNHVRITGISISKDSNNFRHLTVGRKLKNKLYQDALNALQSGDKEHVLEIKGMQSFILSVEKDDYENIYSQSMRNRIIQLGFSSLKELIDSL